MAVQPAARLDATYLPLSPGANPRRLLQRRLDGSSLLLRSSFLSPSLNTLPLLPPVLCAISNQPKFSMRAASKQAYICRDCGYIYKDRTPFEKQPDNYFCPVCAAPKRRFRVYEPPVSKNANQTDARKARKAQLQRDESIGKALPIGIVVGVVALVGLYFYLNSVF